MKIFKEVKEIAKAMSKVRNLSMKMAEYIDPEGIDWSSAAFVSLDKEDIEHFDESEITDEYFVDQWTGYCEDDYHGYLYFKTDVPGQYVRVRFDM